jgi:hypothetical protein
MSIVYGTADYAVSMMNAEPRARQHVSTLLSGWLIQPLNRGVKRRQLQR